MKFPSLREAGKRHNAADQRMLQTVHDHAVSLGASCAAAESELPTVVHPGIDTKVAESDMSYGDVTNLLRMALKAQYPGTNIYVWTKDVYADSVVYEVTTDGTDVLYQRSYALVDGAVTFGDATKVVAVTNYVPVAEADTSESEEIVTDLVPLVEKAVKTDGTAKIKIIQAGFGSSGFYPVDVLKRDAAVFKTGTHIYLDHPSVSEESDRPERSVKDLAGSLTGPAIWEETGAAGPGLYAPVKFIDSVAPHINAIAAISGMSIRASGTSGTREVDGKRVRSIESIELAHSIDVVTKPGAGGKVLDLIESARGRQTTPPGGQEVNDVDKAEFEATKTALAEAQTKLTALEQWKTTQERREVEAALLREARIIVVDTLKTITLPALTRERLTEQLVGNPPVKDGALDRETLITSVQEAAKAEAAYLASVIGGNGVRGMGGETPKEPAVPTIEESEKRIKAALVGL